MNMNFGMLWYDASAKPTSEKIKAATAYCEKKYGEKCTIAHVHPSMVIDPGCEALGITVIQTKIILPNHVWVGRE